MNFSNTLRDGSDRLKERFVKFNPVELQRVAGRAIGEEYRPSIMKLAEGGFNKIFLLRSKNNREIIARIPTLIAGPPRYSTASEVATMDFLRRVLKVPVPKILAYSTFINQSGPMAARQFWHGERGQTKIDRGPWLSPEDCMASAARREKACTSQHAKPRPRRTFLLPTTHGIDPSEHVELLSKFLDIAPLLIPPGTHNRSPILRHPDLSLSNILLEPNSTKILKEQQQAKTNMRRYLYQQTGYPWDADLINLRAALVGITAPQVWGRISSTPCPVLFTDQERQAAMEESTEWNESEQMLSSIRAHLGIDLEGGTEPENFDEEDERDICWRNWPYQDDTDVSLPPREDT
ncbi:hypothetical protein BO71DRAFT_454520 [Aspergillus ellipticus CBS 707.79]|uniref:Aminoglycoside phosphotransferase domain-containing protein n=1 Tax=Aspergillus ellipticus CBS 707.79 TaxID=1448320 RepID=A0A319DHY4_9EURO|nr:hypothetical protein BO71DRAFT_454520 [Aspergillus ellipticus CBS 707.79]